MEAEWVADRAHLRQLLGEQAQWSDAQLAAVTGRSVSWVKKWKKRLRATSADDERVLFSQSRARQHPPAKVSQPVVEAILAIREQPPEDLQRTPGPLAILYYLPRQAGLAGQRLPTSTSTVWRILDQYQRIVRPTQVEHQPLERLRPHEEWQVDFKDVTMATTETEKRAHQVETFNVVDAGTSLLVANPVRSDFTASTVIETLLAIFQAQGLPQRLRCDRDPRFVGSASGRDFPAALVRCLLCLGVEPIICPPQQPQKNPFVERSGARWARTYEVECLRTKQPSTVEEVQAANDWFRPHYNDQRPHQGRSCGNQPPRLAFPDLPPLPPPPAIVDPDAWLTALAGRYYRRRITSKGTLQLGRQLYYIGTEYAGQAVVVTLRSKLHIFDVLLGQTVIKSLSLKGLHHRLLPLDDYLHLICQEAESEYRQYLASQVRYLQEVTM
ncbi:MAG TPA: integrase core domain-containing protein [Caldilineaceae bacterium]|nr:integrase core domain-containing protein [Caldilineaceae bacterium]